MLSFILRVLPVFMYLGMMAAAIGLFITFWPVFVGLGLLAFVTSMYLQWRKEAQIRKHLDAAEVQRREDADAEADQAHTERVLKIARMNARRAEAAAAEVKAQQATSNKQEH